MSVGNEVGNLSIAVAGDVLQGSVAGRTLVQTLDRHDREELVDKMCIRDRLKEHPEERLTASAILYSRTRNEVWMVGDCQAIIIFGETFESDEDGAFGYPPCRAFFFRSSGRT